MNNVRRAVRAEWLTRWTWNPRGISRAGSNPARSVQSCFFRNILGRSWEHEPILVFASNWDWRTKDSQVLFLERTCRRHRLETTITTILSKKSNNKARKKESTDGIKFHQNTNKVKRAVMAEWLRRWTWNPMGISRAGSNPARSVRSFFFQKYIRKKLGTRTNTCTRKQLRLTNQRFSITFPGKHMQATPFGNDHQNPQQKSNNNASKN